MAKQKTVSKTSPQSSERGCLCPDGTYSKECCNGNLEAQGIGALNDHAVANVNNTSASVTVTHVSN
jgi:hypothetical protein